MITLPLQSRAALHARHCSHEQNLNPVFANSVAFIESRANGQSHGYALGSVFRRVLLRTRYLVCDALVSCRAFSWGFRGEASWYATDATGQSIPVGLCVFHSVSSSGASLDNLPDYDFYEVQHQIRRTHCRSVATLAHSMEHQPVASVTVHGWVVFRSQPQ
eukprot:2920974-Amphidinium_carterae.1